MARNLVKTKGLLQSLTCSDPATPASGDPVRIGGLTGVAITNEGEGQNDTGKTSVDMETKVWRLSVKAVDSLGNSDVAVGDKLYYTDADTPKLSKKDTGTFFGYALEVIASGATATIEVLHVLAAA